MDKAAKYKKLVKEYRELCCNSDNIIRVIDDTDWIEVRLLQLKYEIGVLYHKLKEEFANGQGA